MRCVMTRRLVRILFLTLATVGILGVAQKDDKASGKKEKPFAVYLYEVPKPSEEEMAEEMSLTKVREEILKKIKERKKWFWLVESPLEADVLLEITKASKVEDFDVGWSVQKVPLSQGGTEDRHSMESRDRDTYFIECRCTIPKAMQGIIKVKGATRGRAADEVPRRLNTICEAYLQP